MPVVIGEVDTEVVLASEPPAERAAPAERPDDAWIDLVVRRAAERVLETLRREWER
jgi:hypothetical protein